MCVRAARVQPCLQTSHLDDTLIALDLAYERRRCMRTEMRGRVTRAHVGSLVFGSKMNLGRSRVARLACVPSSYVTL